MQGPPFIFTDVLAIRRGQAAQSHSQKVPWGMRKVLLHHPRITHTPEVTVVGEGTYAISNMGFSANINLCSDEHEEISLNLLKDFLKERTPIHCISKHLSDTPLLGPPANPPQSTCQQAFTLFGHTFSSDTWQPLHPYLPTFSSSPIVLVCFDTLIRTYLKLGNL